MKRYWPYLVLVAAIVLLGVLIVSGSRKRPRQMDERVTLKKDDKIPYGTSAAKHILSATLPGVPVYYSKKEPALWDSINRWGTNQAVFIVASHMNADEYELENIVQFALGGNDVFIISRTLSYDVLDMFGFNHYDLSFEQVFGVQQDSLKLRLTAPVFTDNKLYVYPGKKHESFFIALDTARTIVLGRDDQGHPNFIQMNAGAGRIFVHLAPLAFSNYFLLHGNNHQYLEQVMGLLAPDVEKILWNEYYLVKRNNQNQKNSSWLRVLMRYPAFKWGLITGIGTLLLFVLLNMRRRQRMIPLKLRPRNESLDFVKTLGRLYYQRKDHSNLAVKMSTHFLDHVRTRYKLGTVTLDQAFIKNLHFKSGYPEKELEQIIEFIQFLKGAPAVSERQLAAFHKKLELFYQNT